MTGKSISNKQSADVKNLTSDPSLICTVTIIKKIEVLKSFKQMQFEILNYLTDFYKIWCYYIDLVMLFSCLKL